MAVYKIGDYVFKFLPKIIRVYNVRNSSFISSINYENSIISYDFLEKKKIIILNKESTSKKKRILSLYNVDSGREIFSIEYLYKEYDNDFLYNDYYILFEEHNTIGIYENGKDSNLYSLLDGSKLLSIKNALEGDYFQFFDSKIPEEKYLVSVDPYIIWLINIKTGTVKAEVKFKKSGISDIGLTLNEIDGLVYITYQDEAVLKSNGIACIDIKGQNLVWSKVLQTAHLLDIINSGNDIITFDNAYLYRLDKKTGNEVWKTPLNDPKNIRRERGGILVGLGMGKTSNLAKELGFSGFALIKEETGEVIWSFNAPKNNIISDIAYNSSNGNIYFCADKTFYILNTEDGKVITNKKLNLKESIISTIYLKDKNRMLLFSNNYVSLYDINNDKINYSININEESFNYFMFEAKIIGNYLVYTGITPAFRGRSIIRGACIRTLVDIGKGEVIWQHKIGENYYEYNNGLVYYLRYGTEAVSKVTSLFFPRKDLFEDNMFIIHETSDSLFDRFNRIVCYEMFPENNKPTKEEIHKMKTVFGVNEYALSNGYIKRELAGYNRLWENE